MDNRTLHDEIKLLISIMAECINKILLLLYKTENKKIEVNFDAYNADLDAEKKRAQQEWDLKQKIRKELRSELDVIEKRIDTLESNIEISITDVRSSIEKCDKLRVDLEAGLEKIQKVRPSRLEQKYKRISNWTYSIELERAVNLSRESIERYVTS